MHCLRFLGGTDFESVADAAAVESILFRQISRPPELTKVRFWLIPKPRVSVSQLYRLLVFLGIVLFQPEPLVDRVHRLLHDVLHLGLRYARGFRCSSAPCALFSRVT